MRIALALVLILAALGAAGTMVLRHYGDWPAADDPRFRTIDFNQVYAGMHRVTSGRACHENFAPTRQAAGPDICPFAIFETDAIAVRDRLRVVIGVRNRGNEKATATVVRYTPLHKTARDWVHIWAVQALPRGDAQHETYEIDFGSVAPGEVKYFTMAVTALSVGDATAGLFAEAVNEPGYVMEDNAVTFTPTRIQPGETSAETEEFLERRTRCMKAHPSDREALKRCMFP